MLFKFSFCLNYIKKSYIYKSYIRPRLNIYCRDIFIPFVFPLKIPSYLPLVLDGRQELAFLQPGGAMSKNISIIQYINQ